MSDHDNDLSRREAIKLGAAATVAASLGVGDAAAQVRVGGFFTEAEFALLDELSEMIIPTDDHSPGARAAKVAAFIDARLAEAWEQKDRTDWRSGLALVDRLSQEAHKLPFMKASPEQRLAVLTRMAQNESNPQKPEEKFFKELKSRVVYAYYTSEIGIKQEMEYKGNTYQSEFAGIDVSQQ
jgi:Gluconate 2-dehydrogenase subunit 3